MSNLQNELKELIIDVLNLEDVTPEDIIPEEPLFVEGLGLDSIDALELGVALKKRFSIVLDSESSEVKEHFASLNALTAFVEANRK